MAKSGLWVVGARLTKQKREAAGGQGGHAGTQGDIGWPAGCRRGACCRRATAGITHMGTLIGRLRREDGQSDTWRSGAGTRVVHVHPQSGKDSPGCRAWPLTQSSSPSSRSRRGQRGHQPDARARPCRVFSTSPFGPETTGVHTNHQPHARHARSDVLHRPGPGWRQKQREERAGELSRLVYRSTHNTCLNMACFLFLLRSPRPDPFRHGPDETTPHWRYQAWSSSSHAETA